MTKQEYLEKLNKAFGDFKFYESDHHYEYKGERVGISTTGLISQYENEFDSDKMSKIVADKKGTTQQKILEEWRIENKFSTTKGSHVHIASQEIWKGINYEIDYSKIDSDVDKNRLKIAFDNSKKIGIKFYEDFKNKYDLIKDELLIASTEYDIAGSIDALFYNKLTGGLVLADFKTNKEIKYNGYKNQKMLVPLNHLEDCNFVHYEIQTSVYRYLLEKYTDLKIDEMFLIYINENSDDYEIIECKYLKKEVEKILNLRKVNKMARMLLIIGEGGSGKTSSLRNLKPEEHFYIDCDKKGLNYKGWKEQYIEKKNYFKTNDGEVVIKLLKEISEKKPEIKYITIDTINSIMVADEMKRMKGKSYNEWQDLAKCIFDIIDEVPDLREDLTVIFMGHTQTEEDGFIRLLTNGRKLNKIGLEKYFNTVLLSKAKDGEYIFETRANNSTARTPFGAFEELEIPNDITKVIEILKEY